LFVYFAKISIGFAKTEARRQKNRTYHYLVIEIPNSHKIYSLLATGFYSLKRNSESFLLIYISRFALFKLVANGLGYA